MATKPEQEEAAIAAAESYNASDPDQVKSARRKAGRQKKKSLEVVQALMDNEAGREWLYRVLCACDVFRISYIAGEPEGAMHFRNGKQFIGLQLLADIRKASPEKFTMMLDECEAKKLPDLFPTAGI